MKKLTMKEICTAVQGLQIWGKEEHCIDKVSTDSRAVKNGELFFALIGENHDAHKFIPMAIESGCRAFIVSDVGEIEKHELKEELDVIQVADTTKALQDLAAYYLNTFELKKIGVTGSTGKTTTKDMLYHICNEKFKTARNVGNLNNHIGLPLTVLGFEEGTEVGILEMGMSEFGEIHTLADLVRPDIGIITNIGTSHIENLGSREGILKAKLEITDFFHGSNTLIINEINDLLTRENTKGAYKTVTIGNNGKSDYIISDILDFGEEGIEFTVEHQLKIQHFKLPVPGRHNAINATLAAAAGMQIGISLEEAARGLSKMELTDKRLNIKGKGGMKVIDDTYNASPDSMKAAIDVLMSTKGMRKVAILADMLEMGKDSPMYHAQVGEYAAQQKVDLLIAVGKEAKYIAQAAAEIQGNEKVCYYSSKEKLMSEIGTIVRPGDIILIKGSRGMAMDQVVKKIME
ncbi:UDP-N-acetylmuramoyl-tripeptide--D-alanyl-D-alanine ligase [Clostridium aminobutyricum]|uniref:UDP-N-acetylmuramoyl-tripeptide--D-alanyl-D-alanine ligase n=1 Tax=Clostridium aminobutyricum TaxID=33953 RepID=A0A939DA83_CLOAM|nr:UDP-N-acetylmuramoyl-tripeptide--D-alanyl-D-alanine ligase [Clostridium aminobutyricum]MBN7774249.1 UDP-N-acetylmuramoyl-tripeptide--D-alanyl-D-alanine ligase [Clostridium aminobutyricum]